MTMRSGVDFGDGAFSSRILVVEGDPDSAGSLAALLGKNGLEVELTSDRDQTLQRLESFEPQVAIVDILVGRQNDFDLIRRLVGLQPNLLSIISTSSADIDTAIAAIHAGACDYLHKPVDERELLVKLKRCFDTIRLEKRLRQAQKMEAIGTLAGGIAHDFNNILAAILGYTELARFDIKDNERAMENLDKALQASYRAKDLVAQILAFSRQAEQEKIPVHISSIVKEVMKLLRASLPATIEIRQNIQGDFGNILADPSQIQQILVNICTNAGRAMRDSGGSLDVRLDFPEADPAFERHFTGKKPKDYIRLSIADTGPGMSPEVLERIFDPYFTTKKDGQGTGLGLAVVFGIVKSHNGHITVTSEVGKGATFVVYLPRITERTIPWRPSVLQALPSGHERILLVDDEPNIVDLERQMLERLGYHVDPHTDSREALETFLADPQKFDLVITDMTMPGLTGDQLAMNVRETNRTVPIVLCTGYNEKISAESARKIGVSRLMFKPLALEELAKAIRQLLDKPTGN